MSAQMSIEELQARLVALEEENERQRRSIDTLNRFVREGMGSYIAHEVLDVILQQEEGAELAGERREVSMMFADIRHSTELAESMDADDYVKMLNHYLEDMIEIIDSWQGNITGFAGDSIVVVYGAPKRNERAAFQAVGSAVAMQRRMPSVNEWNHAHGYPTLEIGIGIHVGEAVLGCIGSQTRMKYDMIGRNVNMAARIQGFSAGGQILVSTEALNAAGNKIVVNPHGSKRVRAKGIRDELLLHDVVGFGSLRIPRCVAEDLH